MDWEYKKMSEDILESYKGKKFRSLDGCPEVMNNFFDCSDNLLKSLKYCPKIVKGYFDCSYNLLITLEESPKVVLGEFNCSYNKLKNLKGSPEEINGSFMREWNELTSLDGSPKIIKGIFFCRSNKNLKNIKQQIIENQIMANSYQTDEGNFNFEDIKKDFLNYKKQLKIKNINLKQLNKINSVDYGLSF